MRDPLFSAENGWHPFSWTGPYFSKEDTPPALEEVLSKHASVYPEGLGRMKNIQAWIHLEGVVSPHF